MLKSACRLPQIPFYKGFFKSKKEGGASFEATCFEEMFDHFFSVSILNKLGKRRYQTVFTSQVIQ